MLARIALAAALLGVTTGCSKWFFSSLQYPDRSRPVARIETRDGVEYGATTTEGILFLGRTAQTGPCRVHYFLGYQATPLIDAGEVRYLGSVFYDADIDLKTEAVDLLPRNPTAEDDLVAIVHLGFTTADVPVTLATDPGVEGDVLNWPGARLPAGTGIFRRDEEDESLLLVGLVSGIATVEGDGPPRQYVTYAGTDRLRELLAVPRLHPVNEKIIYRPDDITIIKPETETAK